MTGASGVIGSPTIRRLLADGIRVIGVDNRADLSLFTEPERRNFEFRTVDLTDSAAVDTLLVDIQPQIVIHLAAVVSFEVLQSDPGRAFDVNAGAAVYLMRRCYELDVQRFVYASSKAVYGHISGIHAAPTFRPVPESHPLAPVNIYDGCKAVSETIGRAYAGLGLDYTALRFGSIYGPGKKARHGYSSLFSRLVEDSLAGLPIRESQGADQIDDLVYVEDCASALVEAAKSPSLPSTEYNVGSGSQTSVSDFVDAVRDVVPQTDIAVGPGGNYAHETVSYRCVLDTTRIRAELGFQPTFSLRDGVASYADRVRTLRT